MEIYDILLDLGITYKEIEHEPVYTVEEAQSIKARISGVGCKNLFLTDKAKAKYLLVILEEGKRADLKQLASITESSHLSFANSDELYEILHLFPGSISPFGIIADEEKQVVLLIDADLRGKCLLFHPNTTKKTLSIHFEDLIRFIEYTGHSYVVF